MPIHKRFSVGLLLKLLIGSVLPFTVFGYIFSTPFVIRIQYQKCWERFWRTAQRHENSRTPHHLDRLPASISLTKVQKSLQTEQNGACQHRSGGGGGLRLPRDIHIVMCTFDSFLCTSACNTLTSSLNTNIITVQYPLLESHIALICSGEVKGETVQQTYVFHCHMSLVLSKILNN